MTPHVTALQKSLLFGAIGLLLALRLWFHFTASPLPDEAYYWLWGRNLEWSYFDHPPLQAWMQALFHAIFGTSLFALRLPAVVTSAIVFGCLIWWSKRASEPYLMRNVAVILASPLLFLMSGMVFNDHLLIALLSLALIQLFLVFEGVIAGKLRLRHLYLAALLIGLAGLTKYNAALFALGAFLMIPSFAPLRPLLRNPHLYMAALLTLACLIPVFIWNAGHAGASFQYNLNDRLTSATDLGTYFQRATEFLVGFVLALSPILFGAILGLFRPRPLPKDIALLRPIALWIFGVSTGACLILSYWTPVIYYWNVIAVVAVLPLVGMVLRPKWLTAHLVFGLLVNGLLIFNHTIFPISALGGRSDDESALMYGWPQISATVAAQGSDFIVTTDYRSGSILAFWLDKPDVDVIATRLSQFTLWMDLDQHRGQNAVILSSDAFPMTKLMQDSFAQIDDLGAIEITQRGYFVTRYYLHRGIGFQPPQETQTQ